MKEKKENKNVFVYDTTKGFSRFIKKYFKNYFNILCCTNKKKLPEQELTNIDFAFIIINDFDDIISFIWIYSKVKILFIGTNMIKLKTKLKDEESIILLDLSKKKDELIIEIKNKLKLLQEDMTNGIQ